MERFSFGSEVAFAPRGDLLEGVTVAPLTPSISEGSPIQAAIFRARPVDGSLDIRRRVRRSSPSSTGQAK